MARAPTIHEICPATESVEPPALVSGALCGPYRVEGRVAVGGVGDVYEAVHTILGRRAALKVLQVRHAKHTELADRLAQEARVLSRIRHPNLVSVHDAGVLPGSPEVPRPILWMAMEFLEGRTLREALWPNQRLAPLRALDIAKQIALGVRAAHDAGAVHRDLKPENVMLCHDGRVVVLDLGTAKYLRNSSLRPTQRVMGTVPYMSPEHLMGQDVDFRSDVYSLGLVLWEMLVGHHPFSSSNTTAHLPSTIELARRQMEVVPRPPHELVPELSPQLWDLLGPALRKEPRDRHADMNVFAAVLQERLDRLAGTGAAPRSPGADSLNTETLPSEHPTRTGAARQARRRAPRAPWYRHWASAVLFGSALGVLAFYALAHQTEGATEERAGELSNGELSNGQRTEGQRTEDATAGAPRGPGRAESERRR